MNETKNYGKKVNVEKKIGELWNNIKTIIEKIPKITAETDKEITPVIIQVIAPKKDKEIILKKKNESEEKRINIKGIAESVKDGYIYIDITNLIGDYKLTENSENNGNIFTKNPLLKVISYILTSNNNNDEKRIIYFTCTQNEKKKIYILDLQNNKSYIKELR